MLNAAFHFIIVSLHKNSRSTLKQAIAESRVVIRFHLNLISIAKFHDQHTHFHCGSNK